MEFGLLTTVLVAGTAAAGLYGLLPIAIILSYRISRTIAFVHGGIAAAAALMYWLLQLNDQLLPDHIIDYKGFKAGERPELDPLVALAITIAAGMAMGAIFGMIVMSRKIAGLSVLTLTIISLGTMMGLIGVFGLLNVQPDVVPQSPFGNKVYEIFGVFLTAHKLITLFVVIALSAVLAVLLTRTHTGLVIRALADDQEAGVWCGVKLRSVGTLVYAGSGAFAALAGILIAVQAGPNPADMLTLFLEGVAIAIVGGMRSLPLAAAGAWIYGIVYNALTIGLFGDVDPKIANVILYGSLLVVVVVFARLRSQHFFLLERQSL